MVKFSFLLLFTIMPVWAVTEEYATLKNQPCYANEGMTDDYQKQRCVLDLYYPEDGENFSTIVWFHGGGLKSGQKKVPDTFKNKGVAVAAVNYRLSPGVKSPAYIEDAAAAVAWVVSNVSKYGGDPNAVFVSGHSAGGYLALILAMDKQYLQVHGVDADKLAGYLPISGQVATHSTIRAERGLERRNYLVDDMAPLHHIRKGCAPVVLITGDRGRELWARYEANALFAGLLKHEGNKQVYLHELDGFNHGSVVEPGQLLVLDWVKKLSEK